MTDEIRQCHSTDVMDLPSMETVVSLLNEGTVSNCNTCKSLLDAQVDPTTSSNYEQMRKNIERAEFCLKKSKTTIEEKRKYLEQCIERLIKEKGNAEQQNKEKCNASDRSQEIERQRARENTGKGVTIGGAVLTAIPIIGWIPGIIMLAVGTSEIVKASNAIRDAEHERDKEIAELKQNLQFTAEIQKLVSSAVNLLTVLSGIVTALERQTQSVIHWEPVIKVMEDVMKAADNVAENRLVYSQNVSSLINTLREKVGEILALLRYQVVERVQKKYTELKVQLPSKKDRESRVKVLVQKTTGVRLKE